jgi:hypothetical protein
MESAVKELLELRRLWLFMHEGKTYLYCPNFKKHQLFHKNERAKYTFSDEEIAALVKHSASTVQAPYQHPKELVIGNGELVTGNGQRVIGNGELVTDSPEALPKKPKRKSKPKDSAAVEQRRRVKEFWIESYQNRFGHSYQGTESMFFNTQVKRICDALGAEKAKEKITQYLAWNDPAVTRKGHPIHWLLANLQALEAALHRPEATMKIIAQGRAIERVLTEPEQRLAEMKAYANSNTTGHKNLELDQRVRGALSHGTKNGIPDERRAIHIEEGIFSQTSRVPAASGSSNS